jgi:peptide chain release factor 2
MEAEQLNIIENRSPTSPSGPANCGGIFDYDQKADQLKAVARELEDPKVWDNAERAQELGREKRSLENVVLTLTASPMACATPASCSPWRAKKTTTTRCNAVLADIDGIEKEVAGARVPPHVQQPGRPAQLLRRHPGRRRRHRGAGLGGDAAAHVPALRRAQGLRGRGARGIRRRSRRHQDGEHQDLRRVRLRHAALGNRHPPPGAQVAVRLERPPPYQLLLGVAYPEIDDSFEVEINPADLRIDTYRASGAGGQHINKTDSAVRITHLPTNIVVQCQNDRSQHRNRAEAMAMLKSRLYEAEMRKRQAEQQKLEDAKSDIGWGHQIRSYVLDQSRIKDLRTNVEVGNTQGVLDGDLDQFIEASLKQGV